MSIIDTSGWIDAALAGQRARLAEEDQGLRRDHIAFQRDRIRRQDEQERSDQLLYGSLWDMIAGSQPQQATQPTDYTMGPPTLQQQQQQAAAGPSGGMGGSPPNPNIRNLLTGASRQGGAQFLEHAARIQRDSLLREEKLHKARAVAQRYAPLIDEFDDPEDRTDFRMALEDVAAGVMPADQLYEAVHQIRQKRLGRAEQSQSSIDRQYLAERMGGMGPGPNPAAVSPNILMRERAFQQQADMLGNKQDFTREMEGTKHNNRVAYVQSKAEIDAQAKQLTPEAKAQRMAVVSTMQPNWTPQQVEAYVIGEHAGMVNQLRPNIGNEPSRGLTQADKDAESVLRLELDARERQLRLVMDQVKEEKDPARKSQLVQRANGMNSEVIQLEEQLQEHLRSRRSGGAPAAPPSTPPTAPTNVMPVVPPSPPGGNPSLSSGSLGPAMLQQIVLPNGATLNADPNAVAAIAAEEKAKGGTREEVAARVMARLANGGK